jgi:hypothetical protein
MEGSQLGSHPALGISRGNLKLRLGETDLDALSGNIMV